MPARCLKGKEKKENEKPQAFIKKVIADRRKTQTRKTPPLSRPGKHDMQVWWDSRTSSRHMSAGWRHKQKESSTRLLVWGTGSTATVRKQNVRGPIKQHTKVRRGPKKKPFVRGTAISPTWGHSTNAADAGVENGETAGCGADDATGAPERLNRQQRGQWMLPKRLQKSGVEKMVKSVLPHRGVTGPWMSEEELH